MKTPVNVLFAVIFYWLTIYAMVLVPKFNSNYVFNLFWTVVMIPNVFRLIVGSIPQLAVDRSFFFTSTILAVMFIYGLHKVWGESKDYFMNKCEDDKKKILVHSVLLMLALAGGAIVTYYTGIDNSIYSNMGWETQTA
jgi:undecaprenyl pyrophosphate phosphatase UppP